MRLCEAIASAELLQVLSLRAQPPASGGGGVLWFDIKKWWCSVWLHCAPLGALVKHGNECARSEQLTSWVTVN